MMIVVTASGTKKSRLYVIEVVDGDVVIAKESTSSLSERDKIVWNLADMYDIDEIQIFDARQDEFRFTEIPSIPVLDEEEAEIFFEQNKDLVFNRILQAVSEGLHASRDTIKLFELNGTSVYITSNKEYWKSGVQQALDHFVLTEQYDKCITAHQILQKL